MMRRLLQDRTAASATEFALVLPLLLIFLLGIIDAGRWIWTYNRAEKAAMMGARFAIVADPVADGLMSKYVGVNGLTQGDRIRGSDFGKVTCTDATCTCATAPCPALGTITQLDFRHVVNRMKAFMPELRYSDVAIEYSSSGLGYAGNPNGPDLSPVVTIRISDPPTTTALQFIPITSFLFLTMTMPTITASMTGEDFVGHNAN